MAGSNQTIERLIQVLETASFHDGKNVAPFGEELQVEGIVDEKIPRQFASTNASLLSFPGAGSERIRSVLEQATWNSVEGSARSFGYAKLPTTANSCSPADISLLDMEKGLPKGRHLTYTPLEESFLISYWNPQWPSNWQNTATEGSFFHLSLNGRAVEPMIKTTCHVVKK
jgi:hypothetical protein